MWTKIKPLPTTTPEQRFRGALDHDIQAQHPTDLWDRTTYQALHHEISWALDIGYRIEDKEHWLVTYMRENTKMWEECR